MGSKFKILENDKQKETELSAIEPDSRILLLSHCSRPSKSCPGKFSKEGLVCPDDCSEDCAIGRLRKLALEIGYKGVCVAAGGSMAIRFVKKNKPKGIVAVACKKELEEGVCAVRDIAKKGNNNMPVIVTIPLLTDGCVDTKLDEKEAKRIIKL